MRVRENDVLVTFALWPILHVKRGEKERERRVCSKYASNGFMAGNIFCPM